VLFPKGFTWLYPIGSVLVLGGLTIASLAKIWSKGKSKSQDLEQHEDSENGTNGHHSKSPRPNETETRNLLHRQPSPLIPVDVGTRGNG
jgi:hypothetical protein